MNQNNWSKDELKAAVEAYFDMLNKYKKKQKFTKSHYYRALGEKFKRSPSAFERRMSNISYALTLQGRSFLPGLKPLKNVGSNVIKKIEEIIADVEGREINPRVEFETKFKELFKNKEIKKRPSGSRNPKSYITRNNSYYRSPEVKLYVLESANWQCELCDEAAPFETDELIPYLELHHLVRLADGGSDTPENAVALCPNCHRKLHYGRDKEKSVDLLYDKIKRLKRE
ncbi:HNH endonuclease [Crocinitomicaceae bacterium]|nr:HNH endonuclease [Crocinitomicaceae bacterium]